MAWWDLGGKDWLKGKPYSGGSPTNYYNSEDIQKFLPVGLRDASGFLNTRQGLANLSKLFTNPGSFTGNISMIPACGSCRAPSQLIPAISETPVRSQ